MKKVFLLLFLCLVISGCSATYNLEYTSDGIKETLLIDQEIIDLDEVKAMYHVYPVNSEIMVDEDDFSKLDENVVLYNQDFIKIDNGYQIKYEYNHMSNSLLEKSNIVKKGFKTAKVTEYDDKRQLTTSANLLAFKAYPELSDLTINITTDYDVLNSNADSINGNTYTWKFTREDSDKSIILLMNKNKKVVVKPNEEKEENKTPNKEEKKDNESSVLVLFGFLGAFIIVLFLLFKFKR